MHHRQQFTNGLDRLCIHPSVILLGCLKMLACFAVPVQCCACCLVSALLSSTDWPCFAVLSTGLGNAIVYLGLLLAIIG
jgi:hypothetical protein